MATRTESPRKRTSGAFTAEERAAMRERSREAKRARSKNVDGQSELLAKIAEMEGSDRVLAERLHALVTTTVPELEPTTWYGMPAYARDGKAVCFFQPAQKFKSRYAQLGFSDKAHLDEGAMWPVYFALAELTAAAEEQITSLLRRAVG
jgi:hypothetical protein